MTRSQKTTEKELYIKKATIRIGMHGQVTLISKNDVPDPFTPLERMFRPFQNDEVEVTIKIKKTPSRGD